MSLHFRSVFHTFMLVSYLMAFSDVMVHTECILRLTLVMQTTSTIISVMSFPLLKLSCTQVATSMSCNFHCGGHQHHCAQFHHLCLLWSHPHQHLPHQLHKGQVQNLQYLLSPHHCCFSFLWIIYIYVSQAFICWGLWMKEVSSLFTPMCCHDEPFNLQLEKAALRKSLSRENFELDRISLQLVTRQKGSVFNNFVDNLFVFFLTR